MIKSINKEDVQLLINSLEQKLKRINEISQEPNCYAPSKALGYAEGTIEQTIKQLKGEYPITR